MDREDFITWFAFLFDASRDGDTALVQPDKVTYGQIRKGAWAVAGALEALGSPPGSVVLPVLSRGLNFCAGFFGAILRGAVPLLMDGSSKVELRKVSARVDRVMTERSLLETVADIFPGGRMLVVDEILEGEAGGSIPGRSYAADDPMCILLTSGSTGAPKENLKSFGNVLDELLLLQREIHGAAPPDRYWCAVPWVHIYGFLNGFLLPLSQGASVAAPAMFLPREAERLLRSCTVFLGVPVQYRALVETADLSGNRLRLSLSSGAGLPDSVGGRFRELAGIPVTEIYGSTEMGGVAVRRSPDEKGWTALPGVEWKIGEEGELLVRSPLMNRSLLEGLPGGVGGWYPSGDCAGASQDGRFLLEGRRSGIIKVGGKRVSAEEIEEALLGTGLVADAAVAPFVGGEGAGEKIGALVVLKEGVGAGRADLRRRCCESLPPYKVPDRIVFVRRIPRGPTGKARTKDVEKLLKDGGP
jgi:acyl-coenzyme A synthetase/AMP-(fatty) acid ligase